VSSVGELTADETPLFDPMAPLTATGNLRRRMAVSRVIESGSTVCALAAVAVLLILVIGIAIRGASVLSIGFITQNQSGLTGGGIANYLLGTFVIVVFGAVIAVPIGVLTGLYMTEFAGPRSLTGRTLKLVLDLLQGVPTIVVGLFVYGLIVLAEHKETGFAASVALAIVMLPLVARASQEVLLLVPGSLREAADALGVARWRTVVGVILPNAAGGIVTGVILATARAAGETAPVLLVNSLFDPYSTQLNIFGHGVPTVPMLILNTTDLALPDAFNRAWGAAFVLLVLILFANILARVIVARSRRRMGL
jgi:phosphate transport system permease protein